jgi:hypothetical protein
VFDEFESLSPAQRHHAETYAIGLVAAGNKTVASIAREVLQAQGKRALNKFLTEYDWDEDQFNHERLEELQKYGETRWSKDGYIILDSTITEKAGDPVPGVGRFYDHAEGDTVWGQDLIYAFYAENKTAYPLTFRLYEQQDDDYGWVVPPRDPEALADGIADALDDPRVRRSRAENARDRVGKLFSLNCCVDRHEAPYPSLQRERWGISPVFNQETAAA